MSCTRKIQRAEQVDIDRLLHIFIAPAHQRANFSGCSMVCKNGIEATIFGQRCGNKSIAVTLLCDITSNTNCFATSFHNVARNTLRFFTITTGNYYRSTFCSKTSRKCFANSTSSTCDDEYLLCDVGHCNTLLLRHTYSFGVESLRGKFSSY